MHGLNVAMPGVFVRVNDRKSFSRAPPRPHRKSPLRNPPRSFYIERHAVNRDAFTQDV
jgi:hypothetical protein